ncbi:LOW QUALITY PROTEIN: hypothetical protein M8C21_012245 [Ambrosia artemisiifolia]|uniref:Uncharacterized protein n=1 Tax=Ambrosia artemisiifolia TaxID=4212 RepID=A0AAD5G6X4_AMBAR|nr:LOW QUALITY PROTEIN: hypothetical protein M8C21_012245 [Ambrosia artemisiifolia]
MSDVYGPNFSEYPDDPEARVIGEGRTRRVYGVGYSNLHVLVTGQSSSSAGSAPSHAEYQRSQEEAEVMRTQMADLEARLDEERKAREVLQQVQEFMTNWRAPSN